MRPGCTPYVLLTAKSLTRDITLPLTPNCRIRPYCMIALAESLHYKFWIQNHLLFLPWSHAITFNHLILPTVAMLMWLLIIIWNRHGHECSLIWKLSGNFIKKCRDFLGRDILGSTLFRAESSLIQSSCRSFIRVIVPYEISKVNFRVETKILVSMSEEI